MIIYDLNIFFHLKLVIFTTITYQILFIFKGKGHDCISIDERLHPVLSIIKQFKIFPIFLFRKSIKYFNNHLNESTLGFKIFLYIS